MCIENPRDIELVENFGKPKISLLTFDENTKVRLNITYKRETLLYSPMYIGDRYSPTYKYIEVQS